MNCSIKDCTGKHYARSWCRKHYRHVVEGGHKEPLPITSTQCQCGKPLKGKASSSGMCRACYYKTWKQNNLQAQNSYHKEYYIKNLAKIKAQAKEWRNNNKDRENASYAKKRKDPLYRLAYNLRSRLYDFLKGKIKHKNTECLTGCSFEDLRKHLEAKFEPGMSWDNYGSYWSVDHIKPLISINPNDKIAIERVSHYSNLRPLTINENSRKAAKDRRCRIEK